ncbi:MAG: hypothetical protein HQK51_17295 [Oligoflexia bacterium]|nr:hypothetical protein [Oligoflexia bacterium]
MKKVKWISCYIICISLNILYLPIFTNSSHAEILTEEQLLAENWNEYVTKNSSNPECKEFDALTFDYKILKEYGRKLILFSDSKRFLIRLMKLKENLQKNEKEIAADIYFETIIIEDEWEKTKYDSTDCLVLSIGPGDEESQKIPPFISTIKECKNIKYMSFDPIFKKALTESKLTNGRSLEYKYAIPGDDPVYSEVTGLKKKAQNIYDNCLDQKNSRRKFTECSVVCKDIPTVHAINIDITDFEDEKKLTEKEIMNSRKHKENIKAIEFVINLFSKKIAELIELKSFNKVFFIYGIGPITVNSIALIYENLRSKYYDKKPQKLYFYHLWKDGHLKDPVTMYDINKKIPSPQEQAIYFCNLRNKMIFNDSKIDLKLKENNPIFVGDNFKEYKP